MGAGRGRAHSSGRERDTREYVREEMRERRCERENSCECVSPAR